MRTWPRCGGVIRYYKTQPNTRWLGTFQTLMLRDPAAGRARGLEERQQSPRGSRPCQVEEAWAQAGQGW